MPFVPLYARHAMVSSVDHLATSAGVQALRAGGTAVDAALAANAVLAVTLPNQCGLGGDLFALVYRPGERPTALNASGRCGSGSDSRALRAAGHRQVPPQGEVCSAPVPGSVDGWMELHRRYGRLPLGEILEGARSYAVEGFPASPYLARAAPGIADTPAGRKLVPGGTLVPGQVIRRPGVGRLLAAIAEGGRESFYGGEFGAALIELGSDLYTRDDLAQCQADWVEPLSMRLWEHDVWAPPPNSQGYIALTAGWIAERLDLPADPDDPLWAHLLIEAIRQASYDRPEVLCESADGQALLAQERLAPRVSAISSTGMADVADNRMAGGTTYLCAVDRDGMAVSLIQSNGMSFGTRLVVGQTGVFLHNRAIGFCLEQGHPAEYGPGRRPPHTLCPVLVTNPDGTLAAVLGSRGGDSQPQIVLQLLVRLLRHGQDPAAALAAGRWVLRGAADETSFNTWGFRGSVRTALEGQVPDAWPTALTRLGHRVERAPAYDHPFGHAQIIVSGAGRLAGSADPRALAGAAAGY